jgi:hypothetical protein
MGKPKRKQSLIAFTKQPKIASPDGCPEMNVSVCVPQVEAELENMVLEELETFFAQCRDEGMVLFYCSLHFGKKCKHNGSLCLATHLEWP